MYKTTSFYIGCLVHVTCLFISVYLFAIFFVKLVALIIKGMARPFLAQVGVASTSGCGQYTLLRGDLCSRWAWPVHKNVWNVSLLPFCLQIRDDKLKEEFILFRQKCMRSTCACAYMCTIQYCTCLVSVLGGRDRKPLLLHSY